MLNLFARVVCSSFIAMLVGVDARAEAPTGPTALSESARARAALVALPLVFEVNQGQVDPSVVFVARRGDSALFLTAREAVLVVPGDHTLRMRFAGAAVEPELVGEEPGEGVVSYLIGADAAHWTTGVPTYQRVRYRDVQPGIDVVFYGDPTRLEYDIEVQPGADPGAFELTFEGDDGPTIDAAGRLHHDLGGGVEVVQEAPRLHQGDVTVSGRYVLRDGHVGFAIGAYDRNAVLVIDPVVTWATWLGSSGDDFGIGLAVDRQGAAYIVGYAGATDFPTSHGAFIRTASEDTQMWFATKLSPDGRHVMYSTFLGGATNAEGGPASNQIGHPAVDREGRLYVPGMSSAVDFPVTPNGFDTSYNGGCVTPGPTQNGCGDGVLAVLDASGRGLAYGTYFGGSGQEWLFAVSLRETGRDVVVAMGGGTDSVDFPTTANAFQHTPVGGMEAMVVVLDVTRPLAGRSHRKGDLVMSTLLGGSDFDFAHDVEWAGSHVAACGEYFAFPPMGHFWRPADTLVCADDAGCARGATCVGAVSSRGESCGIDVDCSESGALCSQGTCVTPGLCKGGSGVMWCGVGADEAASEGWVAAPGYGNDWDQRLAKSFTLGHEASTIRFSASFDLELDYDYLSVEIAPSEDGPFETIDGFTGTTEGFADFAVDVPPDYLGMDVVIRFRVTSDGAWSDLDGLYPSHGAAALDWVEVTGSAKDDFATGSDGWTASERGDGYVPMYATSTFGAGGGGGDGFVAQFDPYAKRDALDWSAVIGGTSWDLAFDLGVDAKANVYVTGATTSYDLPTTAGVVGPENFGAQDGYVLSLRPDGSANYLTYFGGNDDDFALGVSVEPGGSAWVTGQTLSEDFPVTDDALPATRGGRGFTHDYFFLQLSPDGSLIEYATYFGGRLDEAVGMSEFGPDGDLYVLIDRSQSAELPTTRGAADRTQNGEGDPFIMRLRVDP